MLNVCNEKSSPPQGPLVPGVQDCAGQVGEPSSLFRLPRTARVVKMVYLVQDGAQHFVFGVFVVFGFMRD